MALRELPTEVERELESYMRGPVHAVRPAGERVMVGVNEDRAAPTMLRRGWRMATRYDTDLLAVFVATPDWISASDERRRALEDKTCASRRTSARACYASRTRTSRKGCCRLPASTTRPI